ncbi:MAG: phosphatase PAP2 family protein, partial [Anaerolineae bacterium]
MRPREAGPERDPAPRAVTWPTALLAALFLAAFVVVAVQVATDGRLVDWDLQVTEALAGDRNVVWSRIFWLFTLLGNTPVMIMLTVTAAALLFLWGRHSQALLVVAGVAAATGISSLLKALLQRARPPDSLALIEVPDSYGLPSGHALIVGALLGLLALLLWRRSRAPVGGPPGVHAEGTTDAAHGSRATKTLAIIAACVVAGAVGLSR